MYAEDRKRYHENQHAVCKSYIVSDTPSVLVGGEDLKIMQVRPELEEAFLKEYAGRIIAEGNSIQEAIIRFSEKLKG
jgi:hypothetical protein